jgi:hypothetical protein
MLARQIRLGRWFWLATSLGSAIFVQGCAGGVSPQDTANYDGLLSQGNYSGAASFAQAAGKIAPDGASDNLLWSLDTGAAMVYAGDSAHTIPVMDHAEEMMKHHELSKTGDMGQYHAKT